MLKDVALKTLHTTDVEQSAERIKPYIQKTPLVQSSLLNRWLGHSIFFKLENWQSVGAFKARGAMNALLTVQERGQLSDRVVAFSSGNHAQAVAWACACLNLKAQIYIPKNASNIKKQATRSYGASVIETDTRQQAEDSVQQVIDEGSIFIHPYDNEDVILGQGTACLEALETGFEPDAIFAPCGGGGLLSGTYLASQSRRIPVFGAEPLQANDAARSLKAGEIVSYIDTPETLADGARTLRVSPRTFMYLRQLAGFYEITEREIIYWTQWISHLLKITCEPTAALGMAAAAQWIKDQTSPKVILVIISGGNLNPDFIPMLWHENHLENPPFISDSTFSAKS